MEFESKDIACIPIGTDGKFRLFRCNVLEKENLVELGLVKPPEERE